MLAARVVYLGEKHDSARHHDIQRQLLEAMVGRGARSAVGFEIFSREQTGVLMGYVNWRASPHMKNNAGDAEEWLLDRLGWSGEAANSSTWEAYGPLLQSTREHGMVSFGIDLPVDLRSRISKVGIAGLSHSEQALLQPTGLDDPAYESLMRARIKAAHCGFGGDDYLGRLYDNWVARNDTMAHAIVAALDDTDEGPVVVVVGAGHLEFDMGVVDRVAALVPSISQVNLGLRELHGEPQPLDEHFAPLVHEQRDFGPAHPYLWFTTAPGESVDYCKDFGKAMAGSEE